MIVAPKAKHADTGSWCDAQTYGKRVWCRAEQVSHYVRNGHDAMYLASGADGEFDFDKVAEDWLLENLCIFEANLTCCMRKHTRIKMCDKAALVLPILGLYAEVYVNRKDEGSSYAKAYKYMSGSLRDRMFPRTFTYVTEDGGVERQLFGDSLLMLEKSRKHHGAERYGL